MNVAVVRFGMRFFKFGNRHADIKSLVQMVEMGTMSSNVSFPRRTVKFRKSMFILCDNVLFNNVF